MKDVAPGVSHYPCHHGSLLFSKKHTLRESGTQLACGMPFLCLHRFDTDITAVASRLLQEPAASEYPT